MLRYYYRFILLNSRNLIPFESNGFVEKNINYMNIQNFRFASSKVHESRKPLPKNKLLTRAQTNKSSEQTRIKTAAAAAAVTEEGETEKFINSLTNRGDFYGVKATRPASEPISFEIAVSKLKTSLGNNQRISAENFVRAVLIPLQQKNPAMLNMIKLDESYIPYFINCCGLVLSDVTENQKLLILDHLFQTFKDNKIKLDISAYNALLKVWLENNHEFDVHKILEEVEIDLKLEPNIEFYNHLLWRLAELKKTEQIEQMILKMSSRGIIPNFDTKLAQICAASASNLDEKAQLLVDKVLQKYGQDKLPDCFAARIRGTLIDKDIDKLRRILRTAVVDAAVLRQHSLAKSFSSRFILNISYDSLFDIIWRLAKLSCDQDGQEYAALSEQILESAQRTTGFFKRLIRESERHIAHKYYYSAAAIIGDTTRVQQMLDTQRKDTFKKHLMPRLANHMIRNRISNEIIKDVANRLLVYFGPELRFYDDLAFSILLFKDYSYDERFKMFSTFVDSFDPERSRPHLILPILVQCPDLQTKHTLLFRASEIGYTNISLISPFMMAQHFYQPMLQYYMAKDRGTDINKITIMSKVLESFNVKPEETWKSLYDYSKDIEAKKFIYRLPVDQYNLKKWLSNEYEKMFKDKVAEAERKKAKYTYELFQRLLKNQDVERVHSFLIQRGGFPPEMNLDEDIDTLLHLYLRHANFGYIKKLLRLISNSTPSSSLNLIDDEHGPPLQKSESPLHASHLLRILKRYYHDVRNIQSVIEFVYELRSLFPDVVVTMETRYDSSRQFEQLFGAIFASDNITNPQSLHECINLFTLLLKEDFILLLQNETATVFFIERVLWRYDWSAGVDTWLKLQSDFGCANGIFSLMKYAIENDDDNTKMPYLINRAKNFVSSSRVNSLLAGAYLFKDNYEKAKEIFEKERENLQAYDCSNVFQLLLYLRKDGVLNFVELCLKYTDLRNDEKRLNFFIRGIANNYQGYISLNPLKFYFLLKKYGVYFDEKQMEKLSSVLNPSKNAFAKWVFDPKTALLNDTKLKVESEQQQMLKEFEKDFEIIKSGGKIESSQIELDDGAAADEEEVSSSTKVVENIGSVS